MLLFWVALVAAAQDVLLPAEMDALTKLFAALGENFDGRAFSDLFFSQAARPSTT